jgi:hypothetical protein
MMLRSFIKCALRTFLPAAILSGAASIPFELGSAHASVGPKLTLRCFNTKVRDQISCWTWGNSFAGSEWVHVTYNITFLTMPKVNGQRPSKTFKRTVKTNGSGTFTRTPRITFLTFKAHTTYRIAVTGVGGQKDKGITSLAAIGT